MPSPSSPDSADAHGSIAPRSPASLQTGDLGLAEEGLPAAAKARPNVPVTPSTLSSASFHDETQRLAVYRELLGTVPVPSPRDASISFADKLTSVELWLKEQRELLSRLGFQRPSSVYCSVVIPAYKEALRLPPTLVESVRYFRSRMLAFEILVVNDGSPDQTAETVRRFAEVVPEIRLVNLEQNQGKGAAVKAGMLQGRGEILGFIDADGSTPIVEFAKLEAALNAGADMAIGSRALEQAGVTTETVFYRRVLGRAFAASVRLGLGLPERDTQCGFKFWRADAGRFVMQAQRQTRFAADYESIFIAHRVGLQVAELPVNWVNVTDSKVNPLRDGQRMLALIPVVRWQHRNLSPADFRREQVVAGGTEDGV